MIAVAVTVMLAVAAQASACPNDALRSELHSGQLPDCRAYEVVSSGYTESAVINGVFAVSPHGQSIIGNSLGTFGGVEGNGLGQGTSLLGATYLFSRKDGEGWKATALDAPRTVFRSNGMFDAGAGLDVTLWELGRRRPSSAGATPEESSCSALEGEAFQPEGVTDFYIEEPIATFTKIGPATPSPCTANADRYGYLGASVNLSHVLFSASEGLRWPFDMTEATGATLYEYAGVGHSEPFLVGVNGGRGSTALVSHCGTRLGSSAAEESLKGSMYNAISASGTRVFFTAVGADESGCSGAAPPVGELFAREEVPAVAGEMPAAEWRTVAISEPAAEDCTSCLTHGGLRDAFFRGASEDGSKVFFTTEQELLPGATGENLYEYDFDAPPGERVVLVSAGSAAAELEGVARISEDGSHVYFVAAGVLTGSAANGIGNKAVAGEDNLYVYERDALFPAGRTSFIATLSPLDLADWRSVDERPVLASAQGRFLVLSSVADLTSEGLTGGRPQVFQYNAVTGGLVRASVGQDGFNDNGRSPIEGSRIGGAFGYASVDSPATANVVQASESGAVFFESPDALTPQALNDHLEAMGHAVPNIYEYRAGSVYLLSDGRDVSTLDGSPGISLIGSDPSGEDAFFFTSDALVAGDGDTQQDVYDARVDGGFPAPTPLSPCAGEACRGALAGTPVFSALGGSATQTAEAEASSLPSVVTKAKPKPKDKRRSKTKKRRKARSGKTGRSALYGRTPRRRAR